MLYNDSKDQMDAARKIKSLYSQPLSSGFNIQQVKILFRFAMEYLMEQSMLDNIGSPLGLAGIITDKQCAETSSLQSTQEIEHNKIFTLTGKGTSQSNHLINWSSHVQQTLAFP